jgi:hypothetical protein
MEKSPRNFIHKPLKMLLATLLDSSDVCTPYKTKKGQPEWLAPSPKECAWDYNGTNSSRWTGLGRITTCNPSANPNGIFQDEELNFGPLSAFLPPVAKTLSPNFLQ